MKKICGNLYEKESVGVLSFFHFILNISQIHGVRELVHLRMLDIGLPIRGELIGRKE